MIFVEGGGQQLVGFAPSGKSGGPQSNRSGGKIGSARAERGLPVPREAAAPREPSPRTTFLLLLLLLPRMYGGGRSS